MMAEIQQEHDFFTWSIQNFVRKMKKKKKKKKKFQKILYYLTWLTNYMTQINS